MKTPPIATVASISFVSGQETPDFVCKKPKHVPALNVSDAERGEKVVCGKDVTAVVTNKGYFFFD